MERADENKDNEMNNDLAELLNTAIKRIERLEESSNHETPPPRPTRPFTPPMRGGGRSNHLAFQSFTPACSYNSAQASNNDFRRAFPSIGGGGSRSLAPPKKRQKPQQNVVFIKPKESWTHDFCLLSKTNETKSPSVSNLSLLKEAGLGKRHITFQEKTAGHGKMRQVLETIFPKLKSQCGAFEFMRGVRGGTSCSLIPIEMSSQGYTVPYLKEQVSPSTIIYIRPIQSDLSMSKVITLTDDSIKSSCRNCLKEVPLATMRSHLQNCTSAASKISDTVDVSQSYDSDEGLDEIQWRNEEAEKQNTKYNPLGSFLSKCSEASTSLDKKPKSELQHTQTSTGEWKTMLKQLFPLHSDTQIEIALIGCSSMEEAANNIMEVQPINSDAIEKMPHPSSCRSTINLQSLLSEFRKCCASPGIQELTVERDAFWATVLKFYKRKCHDSNSLSKSFEVQFEGEDGLDGGAMKIEFFSMAWEEVTKRLFEGNISSIVPIKDSTKTFLFRLIGIMVVHTVVQNGPVIKIPRISQAIISAMIDEPLDVIHSQLSKHDVPLNASTENLHYLIEELDSNSLKSDACVQEIFDGERKEAYWQIVNSSHWPITETIKLSNRKAFIQEIIYNEIIRSRSEIIKEIKQGLETLGFFSFMLKYPNLMKELFLPKDSQFGPHELKQMLQKIEPVCFAQRQTLTWFMEFIEEGEKSVAADDELPRVRALLAFVTGWETPPLVSLYPTIKVEFLPDDDLCIFPTSSACLSILRLPTVHTTKQKFFEAMLTALKHERRGFPNP